MRSSLAFVLFAACRAADVHYVSVSVTPNGTSCAVKSDGHVTCWGPGAPKEIPIADAVEVSGNSPHYCVRTRGGAVRCWGRVDELGLHPDPRGLADVALRAPAIGISVGGSHACALLVTHQVACWGRNNYLQLGTLDVGTGPAGTVPPRVIPSLYARAIMVGGATTCVVELDGHATCFGYNEYGALGTGDRAVRYEPVRVAGIDRVTDIATDTSHSCAHRDDGSLWCWGDDLAFSYPEDPPPQLAPHRIEGSCSPLRVASGCSIDKAGALSCWGAAAEGSPGAKREAPDAACDCEPSGAPAAPERTARSAR
jgi:hypothetical protein